MRLRIVLLAWAVMLPILAPVQASAENGQPFRIYMALWRGCEDACKGFQAYFRDNQIPVEFTLRNAERDKSRLAGFVREAKEMKPDLVVTWGTSVSLAMLGSYENTNAERHITEIPAVFMIVADPVGAKIVHSYQSSGRTNITGTRNRAPVSVHMKAIRSYRPFRRIGMIYNANELNAMLSIKAMRKVAQELGFELVEGMVPLGDDGKPVVASLGEVVAEVAARDVDFLYVGSSSFLSSKREEFTKLAIQYDLPVVSGTEVFVTEAHGLLAIANRYYNVGQLAALQAKRVLVDHVAPDQLEIERLKRSSLIVNMDTARKLALYPPMDILKYAELINAPQVD